MLHKGDLISSQQQVPECATRLIIWWRLLRTLDDLVNDELQERASNQFQKSLDQTDTEESLPRIIEDA